MSGAPDRPAWQRILISLALTAVLSAAAYFVWIYANIGARKFAGGTLLSDLRFFVGLLAVFLALTLCEKAIAFIAAKTASK